MKTRVVAGADQLPVASGTNRLVRFFQDGRVEVLEFKGLLEYFTNLRKVQRAGKCTAPVGVACAEASKDIENNGLSAQRTSLQGMDYELPKKSWERSMWNLNRDSLDTSASPRLRSGKRNRNTPGRMSADAEEHAVEIRIRTVEETGQGATKDREADTGEAVAQRDSGVINVDCLVSPAENRRKQPDDEVSDLVPCSPGNQSSDVVGVRQEVDEDIVPRPNGDSRGNLLAALTSAISAFCVLSTTGDDSNNDASLGKAVTIRLEGKESGHHPAAMEQCVPLKDLLAAEEQPGSSGKQGNSKVAAVVKSVISSFCAVYGDRHEATLRVKVIGSDQRHANMELCFLLEELLATQHKPGSASTES